MTNEYKFDSVRWCRTMAKAHWQRNEHDISSTFRTVAEEIDAPRARVARLEGAMKPFAEESFRYDPDEDDDGRTAYDTYIKIGQLRAARRALEEK